ncbi:hypothetical protein CWB99_23020 [Pseudoalteromonas rubra]|uniref:DUF2971 domain-containing protein n=2 Tax=Pseudoalteromonas rubra TaxID=43658 RepID=A0A5S3WG61_9GAMM|nr:hypothetical protein CWB99_23020 [Pseudoalteromonas rubra]
MDHRLSSAKTCIDAQVEVTFREVVRQLSETKDLFLDNSGKTLASCFSKLGMSPTMFGHYSGSGKGAVIAYNRKVIERGIADSDLFLHDVNYTADVFKLRLGEIPDYILGNKPKTLEQELLCRKFIDWRYEQEVRLFCVSRDRVNRIVTFPEDAISGICLGPSISQDFSQNVKELCQNKGIPLFKAVRNYGVYTYSALPVS